MKKRWQIKVWHVRRDMKDADDAHDDLICNLQDLRTKGLLVGDEADEILSQLVDFREWINETLFVPNTTFDGEERTWNLDDEADLAAESDDWVEPAAAAA